MKKNLYFRSVIRRENVLLEGLYEAALKVASYPRLFLEVFIRKDFGQRYFKLSSALTLAAILCFFPKIFSRWLVPNFAAYRIMYSEESVFSIYWFWYLAIAIFLIFSFMRWREVKKHGSAFDFQRYSLSSGIFHPVVKMIRLNGRSVSNRVIETYLEPAPFFLLGILLYLLGKGTGSWLILCSLFYSFSYMAAYKKGDDFILDKIDEMIMNDELEKSFIDDEEAETTRGVRFYMDKPTDKEMRSKVAKDMVSEDDFDLAL